MNGAPRQVMAGGLRALNCFASRFSRSPPAVITTSVNSPAPGRECAPDLICALVELLVYKRPWGWGGSAGRLVAHNVTARAVYKGNRGTAGNSISPYSFSPTSLALVARLSVSLDCRCPRRLCSPLACEHTCKATDISSD